MIHNIKEIEEIDNSFPGRSAIMEEHINKFKESFVGTYDELQKRIKEVREEANQIYYRKKKENDKLIRQKEDEMFNYIFDNSLVKNLPNGRKVFDKLWSSAWSDQHSYGYEAVYNNFEEKEDDFLELYKFTQEK